MSTIEDQARAEAEKSITGNGMHVGTITDRLREAFVQGYLAASRREPSGEMSISEPSDTDEREALRDEIAHWQIGSGYYQASIGIDEARDIADHLIEQGWHRQAQITDAQADARAALEAAEGVRRG